MQRGQVFDARLEPVEGSEQGGTRPVIIVSRDAINTNSPVLLAVPCTTHRPGRKVYPTQVLIQTGEAGFVNDSIAIWRIRSGCYRNSVC
ncbi:type II toxin-antitoxin system PemK/MazF family toxin [Synechocystis salina]|uniref:type II toxin-antitoxin system PemK/MazF family toxin n=1 Tax=Synechocystis salina TaxID=945780 RepID=UPI001D1409A5|nr:type II toxin-antitoxin system PemK/MazF family toxin [Synechocystis salina]